MSGPNLRKVFMGLIASIAVLSVVFGIFGNRYLMSPPAGDGSPEKGSAIPSGLAVPEVDSDVPENVAKPSAVTSAGPATDAKFRVFDIRANVDAFSKEVIIVNQWDVIHINLSADDKTYDFYMPDFGLRQTVKKGGVRPIEFQATRVGKFPFYCERCGGPAKGPVGSLVIVVSE